MFLTLMMLMATTSFYDFSMKDINGNDVALSDLQGKTVLVVNVASFCGFTKQYTPLEQIYNEYKDRGFVVLGFPANDFGAQEPGSNEEIAEFCSSKYQVTFPIFSKITVKGTEIHPLFAWLTSGDGNAELAGEIDWNFEKFLIGPDGKIAARFMSKVDPASTTVRQEIERLLVN